MVIRIACVVLFLVATLPRYAESHSPSSEEDSLVTVLAGNHTFVMKLIDKLAEHPHFMQLLKEKIGSPSATGSAYVGEETREIKALSGDQIRQYLAGEGMGLAKAAELNGYPGPKHVLDLSTSLHLDGKTKDSVNTRYLTMHSEAVRLGKSIVAMERRIDSLFTAGTITSRQLYRELDDRGRLEGELRFVHLRAHLETARFLTAEQITLYQNLRGYGSHEGGHQVH